MRRSARSTLLASMVALGLSLVLTSQVLALTWSVERRFGYWGSTYGYPGGVAATSDGALHLVYDEFHVDETIGGDFMVIYRRSTDGGLTWTGPFRPASGDKFSVAPAIAASGLEVNLVFAEYAADGIRLIHRRSPDAGLTWGKRLTLAGPGALPHSPRIARDGAGHVVVTWTNVATGKVTVRVSQDGGKTFGAATVLTTTTNRLLGRQLDGMATPVVGSGFTAVVFSSSTTTVKIRRSTNWGTTWSTAATVTSKASRQGAGAAAAGSTVVVGYATPATGDSATAMRRSTDKGAHFGSTISLAPMSSLPAFRPSFAFTGGKWRVIYERCTSDSCAASRIRYAESSNGASWGAAETVSTGGNVYAAPIGVARSSRTIVAYTGYDADDFGTVQTRTAP